MLKKGPSINEVCAERWGRVSKCDRIGKLHDWDSDEGGVKDAKIMMSFMDSPN